MIGAGIVGVTTAYELAADGHAVTVFERRNTVAAETSFANAGVIAPGYVTPWAAPGMPWKVMSQVFGRHAAVRFAGLPSLAQCRWMWRWWRACGRRCIGAIAARCRHWRSTADNGCRGWRRACGWTSSRHKATWCCCAAIARWPVRRRA